MSRPAMDYHVVTRTTPVVYSVGNLQNVAEGQRQCHRLHNVFLRPHAIATAIGIPKRGNTSWPDDPPPAYSPPLRTRLQDSLSTDEPATSTTSSTPLTSTQSSPTMTASSPPVSTRHTGPRPIVSRPRTSPSAPQSTSPPMPSSSTATATTIPTETTSAPPITPSSSDISSHVSSSSGPSSAPSPILFRISTRTTVTSDNNVVVLPSSPSDQANKIAQALLSTLKSPPAAEDNNSSNNNNNNTLFPFTDQDGHQRQITIDVDAGVDVTGCSNIVGTEAAVVDVIRGRQEMMLRQRTAVGGRQPSAPSSSSSSSSSSSPRPSSAGATTASTGTQTDERETKGRRRSVDEVEDADEGPPRKMARGSRE